MCYLESNGGLDEGHTCHITHDLHLYRGPTALADLLHIPVAFVEDYQHG